jgi:hypothetical protein
MIQTIKSSDKYYEFKDYGCGVESISNCAYRSLEVSNLTNLSIDWGMVYVNKNIIEKPHLLIDEGFDFYNYYRMYTYHCWNFNNENIFDSQFQVDEISKKGGVRFTYNQSFVGSSAVVFDIEHLGKIIPNTKERQKMFRKEVRNYIYKGSKTGADFIYLSGCCWDNREGFFLANNKEWNEEMDIVERKINNYKKSLAV